MARTTGTSKVYFSLLFPTFVLETVYLLQGRGDLFGGLRSGRSPLVVRYYERVPFIHLPYALLPVQEISGKLTVDIFSLQLVTLQN